MIKKILLILAFTGTSSLWGKAIEGDIHSVSEAADNDLHIIRLTNGRVAYTSNHSQAVQLSKKTQKLRLKLDSEGKIISFKEIGPTSVQVREISENPTPMEPYAPTPVENREEVWKIFKNFEDKYQLESQCYNRAHVWAYEEFKRSGLKSEKSFLFFTNSYLRRYKAEWWFHVAPLVRTKSGEQYVLDYRYAFSPYTPKEWTDLFIHSKQACPVVEKYTDYSQNQEAQDCYLINSSMYYWQPWDIEALENTGQTKQEFLKFDIEWAYKEAF